MFIKSPRGPGKFGSRKGLLRLTPHALFLYA